MARHWSDRALLLARRTLQWVRVGAEALLDTEKFVVANRTPYEVIHRKGLLSVRRYPPLTEATIQVGDELRPVRLRRHRVPVVLVPPLAADPLNFDLLPNRSLVRFLLARGFRVYLLDFGSPELDHSHLGLADYTTRMLPEALAAVRKDSGEQELSLLGYCLGGLFCLIYAGWSLDPQLRNIVTIASPIDSHQTGFGGRVVAAMNRTAHLVRSLTPFRIHNIDPQRLNIPGWASSLAFKLTNPRGTLQSYLDLVMNLWDRAYVTEHRTMSRWFNRMHDYPGGIVQDLVVQVGIDNQLAQGRLQMGRGRQARLDQIQCAILAIAGSGDRIVTEESARKLLEIVASHDKRYMVAPGGHAGVFAGRGAPAATWTYAADWLATRSGGRGAGTAARKRSSSRRKRKGASKGST